MKKFATISHWQAFHSYELARASMAGAFIKASEGLLADPMFLSHWGGFAGTMRSPFCFWRDAVDPIAQAKFFCDRFDGLLTTSDMPPTIDLEDTSCARKGTNLWPRVKALVDYVQARTGRIPQIYTAQWWWNPWMLAGLTAKPPDWTANYPLHVAFYGAAATLPARMPKGWASWALWQYIGSPAGGEPIPGMLNPLGDMSKPHIESGADGLDWLRAALGMNVIPPLTDGEKLARLWDAHPTLH